MLEHVKVPKEFEPIFAKAQEFVSKYFSERKDDASRGTVEISGERYLLVRAASMSVDFFETVKELYKDVGEDKALNVARSLLFDIAHAIGKADAKSFHEKMELTDPVERLSAGPIHFAHSGWAFVDIFPESKPSPDENYYLIYDHPFSFESAAWEKAGKKSDCPVCVMNAGYSSGWCEESFGVTLVASEILCKAKGDKACRFIMAHPSKIEKYIKDYLKKEPQLAKKVTKYEIPGFFRRKQIELSLRESEERYKRLFEQSNDAVFIHCLDGEILDVNNQACEMLGYDRNELLAIPIPKLHPEESLEGSAKALEETAEKGATRFESKFLRSDGTMIDVDISARLVDPERRIVQGIVRDITERKRVEKELIEREREIRLIAESSVDAIFLLNKSGELMYVSPSSKEIAGYSPEEMVGTQFTQYIPREFLAKCWTKLGEVFLHRRVSTFEAEIIARDGRRVPVEVNGRIAEHNGQLVAQGTLRDITERKKADQALRESEAKYRDLLNNVPCMVYRGRKDWSVEAMSPYADEITGYDQKSFERGEINWLDLIHPEDKDRVVQESNVITAEPLSLEQEYRILRKDGSVNWVRDIKRSLFQDGRFSGVDGFVVNITKRKKIEEALKKAHDELEIRVKERTRELKESQRLYQTLAEAAKDFIFIVAKDFTVRYLNEYGAQALGRAKDEAIGKSLKELFPPDTAKRMMGNLEKVFERGEPRSTETLFAFPEREFWLHTSLVPLRDEKGVVSSIMGLSRDTTDRKMAEQALKESEERYRGLFEDSPISLWEEDFSELGRYLEELRSSGVNDFRSYFDSHPEEVAKCSRLVRIVDVNRTTLDMYKAKSKEELLMDLSKVFTEESYQAFKDGLVSFAEGKVEFEGEGVNQTLTGKRMDLSIRWAVAPGYEKSLSKVLVSIMDITEHKQLENEVRQALKFKSDFMATMSHELRTPLNSIIACADLLLKDGTLNLSERRKENLRGILGSSDRLISMINNILDMARIEAGRAPIRIEAFSVYDVIRAAVEYCSGLIGEKDLKVVEKIGIDIPSLRTDREKLSHIITNLLVNAIKFTEFGEIAISARVHEKEPGQVVVSVSDTGIGIEEDKLGAIFEQFKQADVSPTRRHGGIGLGLAIVKAYTDLLGGKIEVKSRLGEGSTFTVTLPMEYKGNASVEGD